jgi:hypothetical protein
MDHGGWYDKKELNFRHSDDMQFVAAMGPPGGGRNSVTNRYLRHFSVIRYALAGPCLLVCSSGYVTTVPPCIVALLVVKQPENTRLYAMYKFIIPHCFV